MLTMPEPGVIDIDGYSMFIQHGDNFDRCRDADDLMFLCKPPVYIEYYQKLISENRIKNIIEVGIFKGGGIIFLDRLIHPEKLLGIEFSSKRLPLLDEYIQNKKTYAQIDIRYGLDQADRESVSRACDEFFGSAAIDLIIDDASHWYEESKATFQTLFPRLRPGGIYSLEDWGWAHSNGFQAEDSLWSDKKALTNLVFDIVALHGSRADIVSEIKVVSGSTFIVRGNAELPNSGWSMDDDTLMRGKKIGAI